MDVCNSCPRHCHVNRADETGYCGGGSQVKIAKAMLHFGEEPCITGDKGSGAIFFSGCPLRCVFCQNHTISQDNFGAEISVERLVELFFQLEAQGAHNINLVSPTQYTPQVIAALKLAKPQLHIPVVYNTSGYETLETLRRLEGLVDVYLPDLKYYSPVISQEYAKAGDYFSLASQAILEMVRQTGAYHINDQGLLEHGVLVRHLVLPGTRQDSKEIVHWLGEHLAVQDILLSVMRQYTPDFYQGSNPNLQRKVTTFEYNQVVDVALAYGFVGFTQDRTAATAHYTPDFNLEGI